MYVPISVNNLKIDKYLKSKNILTLFHFNLIQRDQRRAIKLFQSVHFNSIDIYYRQPIILLK